MFRNLKYLSLRAAHAVVRGPRAVLLALIAPLKWFGQLFVRAVDWWSRRESKYLLRGLPSIIVFVGAAYLLVACRLQSDAALADKYLAAAKRTSDPDAKALLYERVVSLRPHDDETLFEFAQRSSDAGDFRRAQVILQKLAPIEGQGYAEAQKVRGRQYLAWQHVSRDYFNLAERHFKNALSLKPGDPETHALLGTLYFSGGHWELAVRHFEEALDLAERAGGTLPDKLQPIRLSLAKAYSFENQLAKAENTARAVRDYYERRVHRDPRDDIEARRGLAEACMFLEDFDTAAHVLEAGLALNPEDASLRGAMARFNVAWADAMELSGQGTRERRFELLSAALLLDPNYAPIFESMLTILTEGDSSSEAARDFLETNVTQARAVGLSHLLLGSAAFESGDTAAAESHLELANQALPNAAIVQNNLAWFLAIERDPPELDRALDLIDDVIKRVPNDPRFLDTRGQIYAKLGRWDEAIHDLERALVETPPARETHLALAECYAAKGLKELAQRHERLAEPALGQ